MSRRRSSKKNLPSRFVSFVKDVSFDVLNTAKYFQHNLSVNPHRESHFSGDSPHPPVILLQGFMGTSSVLKPLDQFLQNNDRNTFILDLGLINVRDIRLSAEKLVFEVERIMDDYSSRHHFKQVDIVAHSMGGLIALYYIKKLGGHRLVRKAVTLGTPVRGTWAAMLGVGLFGAISRGVWQMIPRSHFLNELHEEASEKSNTTLFSIAAQYDTISPPSSCFLKGAVNRILPLGHASLLMNSTVFDVILRCLDGREEGSNIVAFDHFKK